LFAGQRGGGFADQQLAGVGGAGPGDPDVLEDVFEVGLGEVDVVLGHPVGDLTEISTNVRQGGAGPQQVGCQGVPRLVGNQTAQVQFGDPLPEPAVEPLVGQRGRAVGVADLAGEQGETRAFGGGGVAAVPGDEAVQGLALALG